MSDDPCTDNDDYDLCDCDGCYRVNMCRNPLIEVLPPRAPIRPRMRQTVFLLDRYRCVLCGRLGEVNNPLQLGHLISVYGCNLLGYDPLWRDSPANLAAMCRECNLGLGERDVPADVIGRILSQRNN